MSVDDMTLQAVAAGAGASGPGRVEIEGVHMEVGTGADRFEALRDVSVTFEPGQFACLLGPSGCGKSTLLGALAGHLPPARGTVCIDGVPVDGPHPDRGLVFQQHTLFPWLRVIDNVAYGLKMKGVPREERQAQARALLAQVGLAGFERRYPVQLSGGMQQRVEIARVLINRPRVLLMDEPFGALDALTRARMQQLLLEMWARVRTTVVFVTHDIDEALFLADRILVMSARPGRLIEDIPLDFPRPRSPTLVTSAPFAALKRHCLELLHRGEAEVPLPRVTPLGATVQADAAPPVSS
jgi:NitT/TauT family transport system ATP-binding protein